MLLKNEVEAIEFICMDMVFIMLFLVIYSLGRNQLYACILLRLTSCFWVRAYSHSYLTENECVCKSTTRKIEWYSLIIVCLNCLV